MSKVKNKLFLIILIVGFFSLLLPSLVFAQVPECRNAMTGFNNCRIVPVCTDTGGSCGLCDFFSLIVNIYVFIAFRLAPPVAGIFIVFAGALFLFSGGSEERIGQAKKIFINIIIGLVFIYASYLIVNSIIQIIGKSVDGFNTSTWFTFTCTKS
jgi:hypothetical protein